MLKARSWYAERSGPAAERFIRALDHGIERVREHPQQWPRYHAGTHRYLLKRFPFALVYLIRPEVIEIVAVAHQKRRPDYWARRVGSSSY